MGGAGQGAVDEGASVFGSEQALGVTAEERLASLADECARLRAENSELRSVLGSMFGALIVVDAQAVIRSVNQATTAMLGYGEHEIVGRPLSCILPLPEPSEGHDVVMDILDLAQEQRYRTKDGRLVPVLLSSTLLIREAGAVGGAVCVALDVTDTKRLEAELRHAQKLEALGTLAAGIAHEINTPIQFVGDSTHLLIDAFAVFRDLLHRYRGLAAAIEMGDLPRARAEVGALKAFELAEDVDYLEGETPRACGRCQEGLSRVARIVGAMKEFAHPGRREKEPADINRALGNTLEVARNTYKLVADLELELEPLPPVLCHIADLNQVFLNLVVNAAHAIEEVVGASGRKGVIRVRTRQQDDRVLIEVADSGCGIKPEIRDKIFDPFFTTKGVGKGSGQGLAITRSVIVDKHGGTLSFATEVGVGTTFTVALPVSEPSTVDAPDGAEEARG
jgi:PAS domain S-box-containing protein